ncbi:MAG: alpha/beta fold hydrolase [Myxococcota bacterium]
MRRLRGLKALVHDAVDATTDLVGEGHESAARAVRRVTDEVSSIEEPARKVDDARRIGTGAVLSAIKRVNRMVETVTDLGLDAAGLDAKAESSDTVVPMRSDTTQSPEWVGDAALGLINAAVGHHLEARDNGLDLSMVLRVGDHYLQPDPASLQSALPNPSPRVALFVHGLGTTEWSWCLEAEAYHGDPETSFGTLLDRDLGITPVYLRYNTGRRISENGRRLASLIEAFVEAYPIPVEELVLIGHSMGGLVVRSAGHYGVESGAEWTTKVKHVFCLGSPHQGAPLAKAGRLLSDVLGAIDLPATQVTSRIIAGRSHGIQDLDAGAIVDQDWLTDHRDLAAASPTIPGAQHYFVSATVTEDPNHPLGRLVGDLLVRGGSATHGIEESHFAIATTYGGVLHHQLQNHPAIYAQIRAALEADLQPRS